MPARVSRDDRESSFLPPPSPTMCLAAPAEVGKDHHYKVRDKPHIVVSQILVDINKDQHARNEQSKQDVSQLRDRIRRVKVRIQEQKHEQN